LTTGGTAGVVLAVINIISASSNRARRLSSGRSRLARFPPDVTRYFGPPPLQPVAMTPSWSPYCGDTSVASGRRERRLFVVVTPRFLCRLSMGVSRRCGVALRRCRWSTVPLLTSSVSAVVLVGILKPIRVDLECVDLGRLTACGVVAVAILRYFSSLLSFGHDFDIKILKVKNLAFETSYIHFDVLRLFVLEIRYNQSKVIDVDIEVDN